MAIIGKSLFRAAFTFTYTLITEILLLVSDSYSASSATPSASTTRLVSSLEICRASARCISVMVQNDATRWSGDRTGDITSYDRASLSETQEIGSGKQHIAETELNKPLACRLFGQDGTTHSWFI